jgi:hypothetical protein
MLINMMKKDGYFSKKSWLKNIFMTSLNVFNYITLITLHKKFLLKIITNGIAAADLVHMRVK